MGRPTKAPASTRIAQLLSTSREAIGLSVTALARAIGTHESSISNYELGKRVPSEKTCVRLAAALDADPVELLDAAGHTHVAAERQFKAAVSKLPLRPHEQRHLIDTYYLLRGRL